MERADEPYFVRRELRLPYLLSTALPDVAPRFSRCEWCHTPSDKWEIRVMIKRVCRLYHFECFWEMMNQGTAYITPQMIDGFEDLPPNERFRFQERIDQYINRPGCSNLRNGNQFFKIDLLDVWTLLSETMIRKPVIEEKTFLLILSRFQLEEYCEGEDDSRPDMCSISSQKLRVGDMLLVSLWSGTTILAEKALESAHVVFGAPRKRVSSDMDTKWEALLAERMAVLNSLPKPMAENLFLLEDKDARVIVLSTIRAVEQSCGFCSVCNYPFVPDQVLFWHNRKTLHTHCLFNMTTVVFDVPESIENFSTFPLMMKNLIKIQFEAIFNENTTTQSAWSFPAVAAQPTPIPATRKRPAPDNLKNRPRKVANQKGDINAVVPFEFPEPPPLPKEEDLTRPTKREDFEKYLHSLVEDAIHLPYEWDLVPPNKRVQALASSIAFDVTGNYTFKHGVAIPNCALGVKAAPGWNFFKAPSNPTLIAFYVARTRKTRELLEATFTKVSYVDNQNSVKWTAVLASENKVSPKKWALVTITSRLGTLLQKREMSEWTENFAMIQSRFFQSFRLLTNHHWDQRNDFEYIDGSWNYWRREDDIDNFNSLQALQHVMEENSKELVYKTISVLEMTRKTLIDSAYMHAKSIIDAVTEEIDGQQAIEVTNRLRSVLPTPCYSWKPVELFKKKEEMTKLYYQHSPTPFTREEAYEVKQEAIWQQCKNSMKPCYPHSRMWRMIEEYMVNTTGGLAYDIASGAVLSAVLKIETRPVALTSGAHMGTKMLLWHGTAKENMRSILKDRLRLPEPNKKNNLFGDGIYFSDTFSKSLTFTGDWEKSIPKHRYLLLCEVDLGREVTMAPKRCASSVTDVIPTAEMKAKLARMNQDQDSVKGLGMYEPMGPHLNIDGVLIPKGRLQRSGHDGGLLYNEYVVYDASRVKLKYLVQVTLPNVPTRLE